MESWVGLTAWPTADTLPTKWLHVNHRSGIDQGMSASYWATLLTIHVKWCNQSISDDSKLFNVLLQTQKYSLKKDARTVSWARYSRRGSNGRLLLVWHETLWISPCQHQRCRARLKAECYQQLTLGNREAATTCTQWRPANEKKPRF